MAYDTNLASRVRGAAGMLRGVTEKQMFGGRPMRGYVFVAPAGLEDGSEIDRRVRWSSAFVAGLPAKKAPRAPAPGRAGTKAAGGRAAAGRPARTPSATGRAAKKASGRSARRA